MLFIAWGGISQNRKNHLVKHKAVNLGKVSLPQDIISSGATTKRTEGHALNFWMLSIAWSPHFHPPTSL